MDHLSQDWERNWKPLKAQGKGCTGPRDQTPSPVPHHPLAKVITLHIPNSRLDDKYLAQTESGPAASKGDKKGSSILCNRVASVEMQRDCPGQGIGTKQLDCQPLMNHRAGLPSYQQGFLFSARFGDT